MGHASYIREPENARQAVLLIHGICGTPRHFDFLLPAFSQSWAIYNILLDGHGKNVRDFSRTSMKKWKAQTAAMLDMLSGRYDRIFVVGHSMGTLLLLQALPHYPKVCGCVLLNPPMLPQMQPSMLPRVLRLAFGKPRNDDPQDMLCMQDNSITLSKNLFLYFGWIPRYWELLTLCRHCRKNKKLTVPALVYFGTEDALVHIRSAEYFRNEPLAKVTVLEKTGHFGFLPQDQAIISADIAAFLDQI